MIVVHAEFWLPVVLLVAIAFKWRYWLLSKQNSREQHHRAN